MAKSERPIIIKRIIVAGGGHHGGAWKVAYADFVTAMMAFFLLLWLLGSTTEDQRKSSRRLLLPKSRGFQFQQRLRRPAGRRHHFGPRQPVIPQRRLHLAGSRPQHPRQTDRERRRQPGCGRGRAGRGQRPGKRPRPASGRRPAQARRSPVPDAGAARKAPVRQGGRGPQAGAGKIPRPPGPQEQPAGRSDARRHARADRR